MKKGIGRKIYENQQTKTEKNTFQEWRMFSIFQYVELEAEFITNWDEFIQWQRISETKNEGRGCQYRKVGPIFMCLGSGIEKSCGMWTKVNYRIQCA